MNLKENKDVQTIEYNYDNLDTLRIIKYLINVVIGDIEYMNKEAFEKAEDYLTDYDLGNGHYVIPQDLESLSSIVDTINNIEEYNKEI